MNHLVVTRFSVPREDEETGSRHSDPGWLDRRLELFRTWFAPSVGRLGVPVVLLCSTASAPYVGERLADLPWARVTVHDAWRGWRAAPDQVVTRLDSDDALHEGWFDALEKVPPSSGVVITRRFLRLDLPSGNLYRYRRRLPSPLAAFRGGLDPFALDHIDLERDHRTIELDSPYLLQIVHGGNVSSRSPGWKRFYLRIPLSRLAPYGHSAATVAAARSGRSSGLS